MALLRATLHGSITGSSMNKVWSVKGIAGKERILPKFREKKRKEDPPISNLPFSLFFNFNFNIFFVK